MGEDMAYILLSQIDAKDRKAGSELACSLTGLSECELLLFSMRPAGDI
jgi:hypothetical protein